jgi:hypothetical protein
MVKSILIILLLSLLLAMFVAGVLTKFKFDRLSFYTLPFPPNPPQIIDLNIFWFIGGMTLFLAIWAVVGFMIINYLAHR